ncbi:MAG: TerC family protein [Phycisphaerales bacterium]|nr:TerC family protein [Phycisphaerales bacterium]
MVGETSAAVAPGIGVEGLVTVENAVALGTLTAMETVLGIDNIVFIAILASRLPPEQREKARIIGLLLAVVARVLLLLSITWVMGLKRELFGFMGHQVTGKDLVLILGGGFLIYKATKEIHHKVEGGDDVAGVGAKKVSFAGVLTQIVIMDIVFSLDSVITAVGMVKSVPVMITAVIISIGIMLAFSGKIVRFIDRHPSIKILALSFLLLIGVMLVADGLGQHISKGYIYFAMSFSLLVEMLNMRFRRKTVPAV